MTYLPFIKVTKIQCNNVCGMPDTKRCRLNNGWVSSLGSRVWELGMEEKAAGGRSGGMRGVWQAGSSKARLASGWTSQARSCPEKGVPHGD